MKKNIVVTIILTMIILNLRGEQLTQNIRGKVIDNITDLPIIGATIILLGSNPLKGATSDENGEFVFREITVGRHSLEISFIGYQPAFVHNILLTSGKEIYVNVKLIEKVEELEEVTVKAFNRKDKTLNEMAMISARSFTVEETERFAGSLGDPARMVANYAGVMTQNDARNDIIIRGNSPMGVLWRLDGIEIPNPNHFGALGTTGGPVSMLNNNLLTNSDFLTGAFPAEYGNALAGAFDLRMRNGNNAQTEFTGQIGFNGFELAAEGPVNLIKNAPNASYIASFRYSTLEVMDLLGFDMGTGTAIPQYKDFTFKFNLPGTKLGHFKLIGLWGKSYIELGRELEDTSSNSYNPLGTATNFGSDLGVIGISHTYYLNKNTSFKTIVSAQNTKSETKFDSLKRIGNELLELPYYGGIYSENKFTINSSFKHRKSAKDNFEIGLIYDFYQTDYKDSIYKHNQDFFQYISQSKNDLSLLRSYAQWQHKFSDELTSYLGFHYQYFALNNENTIEPRASMQWQFSPKQNISAGFGMHSQIQPRTTYFYESYDSVNNRYLQTNKDLKFTRGIHYVLGYNNLINPNLRVKLETYLQNLYKIPVKESLGWYSMVNNGDNFGVYSEDSLVNEGKGTNYGVELTFEKFLNKNYYFLFTASVFNSTYKGYDKVERNTAFNGNYVFNLLGGYEFEIGKSAMITIDLKTVWAGGKRYIPLDLEKSIQNYQAEYDYSRSYENKYNDYFRTDLRIGLKINKPKYNQEWAVDFQNVTGYQSVFAEGYDAYKQEQYKTYQQGFYPMFLYRIQF